MVHIKKKIFKKNILEILGGSEPVKVWVSYILSASQGWGDNEYDEDMGCSYSEEAFLSLLHLHCQSPQPSSISPICRVPPLSQWILLMWWGEGWCRFFRTFKSKYLPVKPFSYQDGALLFFFFF